MTIKAIITGATGMVGKGVLLECLARDEVESVLIVNRRSLGIRHPKLTEIIVTDFSNVAEIEAELAGYDACFFCLGVSSFRMAEADYRKITHDLTMEFANVLTGISPDMTFCYVSGVGTDPGSKTMWARVKGETETALLGLPFRAAYMFRPGFIQPMKGVKSSAGLTNVFLTMAKPLFPVIRILFPRYSTTSEKLGNAMINAALYGFDRNILESVDINILAKR